ncbi:hypothetical protein AAC387_Pa02g3054 [Persea americana]
MLPLNPKTLYQEKKNSNPKTQWRSAETNKVLPVKAKITFPLLLRTTTTTTNPEVWVNVLMDPSKLSFTIPSNGGFQFPVADPA